MNRHLQNVKITNNKCEFLEVNKCEFRGVYLTSIAGAVNHKFRRCGQFCQLQNTLVAKNVAARQHDWFVVG